VELLVPFTAQSVILRIYNDADSGRRPALVYLHGGFFNSGRIEDADPIARELKEAAVVISVAYPLAPAAVFPAALETGYTVLQWAARNARVLQIDPARLFVGGDQAGGTLAAAIAMVARDRNFNHHRVNRLVGQALITPLLDPDLSTPALRNTRRHPCLQAWSEYLSRPADFNHPYASPLRSRRLAGIASTLLITTGSDPMRDEAVLYANRLKEAGVDVRYQRHAATSTMPANPIDPAFAETAAILKSFINETLDPAVEA
jgi:acetyl esterase/lipase